jgi:hypothetical protein
VIWMTWRQHRGELYGWVLLLAILGLLLLLHGAPMHHAYDTQGIRACQLGLADGAGASSAQWQETCSATVASFEKRYLRVPEQFATWLPFLPMVAGMLIGAPLLAREYEQGTWQLAWTQGVTRRRWLAGQLTAILGGIAVAAGVFAAGLSWWFQPLSPQRFTPEKFNHAVLVFPAYVLLAVTIGVLAGAMFRRTIVAAAVTVAGYLTLRIPIEFIVRPHYRTPLVTDDPTAVWRGWPVQEGSAGSGRSTAIQYQPDDRFWQFQLIETAILLGITAILLATAWRVVQGRRAPVAETHGASHPASLISGPP